jgi:hypothetical protein
VCQIDRLIMPTACLEELERDNFSSLPDEEGLREYAASVCKGASTFVDVLKLAIGGGSGVPLTRPPSRRILINDCIDTSG